MKISLFDALPLRSVLTRKIQELIAERRDVAFIEYSKEDKDTVEKPKRTFLEVTKELEDVRTDFRKLDELMMKANVNSGVEYQGTVLTITEAIELAKQLRAEAADLSSYGKRKEVERVRNFHSTETTYREALYPIEEIKQTAEFYELKARRLSTAIDKANLKAEIDFPEAEKYI